MSFEEAFELHLCENCDQDPVYCHERGICIYDNEVPTE